MILACWLGLYVWYSKVMKTRTALVSRIQYRTSPYNFSWSLLDYCNSVALDKYAQAVYLLCRVQSQYLLVQVLTITRALP